MDIFGNVTAELKNHRSSRLNGPLLARDMNIFFIQIQLLSSPYALPKTSVDVIIKNQRSYNWIFV